MIVLRQRSCLGVFQQWIGRSRFSKLKANNLISARLLQLSPMPQSCAGKSAWKMNKPEIVEVQVRGVPVHPNWTLPEVRETLWWRCNSKRSPRRRSTRQWMKGLSKASLEDLTQRARALNITLPPNPTRGWLIRALRDTTDTRHLRQVHGLDVQRSASACSTWIGAWPRWTAIRMPQRSCASWPSGLASNRTSPREQSENPVIGHGPGSHLRRSRTCTMARRGAMPPSRKRQERQWVGGERPRMQHQSPDCPCSRSAGARVAYSGRLGQHCAGQREPDHAASLTPARSLRTHWTSCLPRSFTMCPLTMCMRTSTTAWTLRQMKTLCVPWQLLRVSTCQRI